MIRTYYKVGIDDTGRKNVVYEGKQIKWMNPCLDKWKAMIRRCHTEEPSTYQQVRVCPEWYYLSNFEKWMLMQDWEGNELDKDLLSYHDLLYSPETCVFIPKSLNYFIGSAFTHKRELPLGVSWDKSKCKYAAFVRKNGKSVGLGRYDTPEKAHVAYQRAKVDIGLTLYEELLGEIDPRASASLENILEKVKNDIDSGKETLSLHPYTFPEEWKLKI